MLYRLLNYFLETRISKKRLAVRKHLVRDLHEQENVLAIYKDGDKATRLVYGQDVDQITSNIKVVQARMAIDDLYTKLYSYFQHDTKRKYMINHNFICFLDAIDYLHKTAPSVVNLRILSAPNEIYKTIEEVEKSFNQLNQIVGAK